METVFAKANEKSINSAGDILRRGGLVGIPTETVYGLAANALDENAVKSIFFAKGRPSDNPLIVHISRLEQWKPLVNSIPEKAKALAEAYWSGPLTIILKKSDIIPFATSGGLDTVAVRMPQSEIARSIIDAAGVPLAAPSANTSGKPSPTTAEHVKADLDGKIDMIIDGGACSVGVESTVITLVGSKPRLLRPGGITLAQLQAVLGEVEVDDAVLNKLKEGQTAASPGMKYKHYAPKADVTLVKGDFEKFKSILSDHEGENPFALCFDEDAGKLSGFKVLTFGSENNSQSQAQMLFARLRQLDEIGAQKVFARYPNEDGVGLAVCNRLIRSAGFKVIE